MNIGREAMSTVLRSEPLAPECGVTVHDVQLAEAEGETLEAIRRTVFAKFTRMIRRWSVGSR